MTHWTRWARWIVAAAGVAFLALVVAGLRPREPPGTSVPIEPADPRAAVEIVGGTSRQWSGADEHFAVKYERQFGYPDGGQRLEGVTVYVDDPEGNRQFVATGHEADISPGQDRVTLKREVRLVSSGGLTVHAEEATYSTADKTIRAQGPVTFSRGRMTGRGVGMTYDRSADELWLQEQANITVRPDPAGVGALEVTAGSAGLARRSRYVRFERAVRMLHDGRRIQAEQAVGYLSEDEDHLSALDLRGGPRIDTDGAAPGALKRMQARDISLTYSADGARIERALLTGAGTIVLAGEARERDRRIGGEMLDVTLGTDGATVTALTGRQGVVLEFPGNPLTPARTIRAGLLDGTPGADGRLTTIRLSEAVEYEETMGAPPVTRVVRAAQLDLGMTAGLTGVTGARFAGAVRFAEGTLRATAETARYAFDLGTIALEGLRGAPPTVADTRMRVDAQHILLTMTGPKIVATGEVRSQLGVAGDPAAAASAEAGPRMPAFLRPDRPVNVTAELLDYDGTASRAAYRGTARLWQGDSAVQAGEIVLDTRDGNLTATGSVRSSWLVAPVAAADQVRVAPVATVASAGQLAYDEAARRATYTTDAHVIGPQGDLTARVVELYLSGEGAELERVEGYEAVTLREPGRTTSGERLSYAAREERYDVRGTPVRIVEGCRESTGRTLTFYKSVEKISIDGQQVSRTRTKSGSGCAEPPRTERPAPGR